MFGPIKNYIFDLDGTLINSMPHAVDGFRHAVKEVSGEALSDEALFKVMGQSPQAMLSSFLGEARLAEAIEVWNSYNAKMTAEDLPAFEGIQELLESIAADKNFNIGVFTGRDRKAALHFMGEHNWLNSLIAEDKIRCGDDGFDHKPSGEAIVDLVMKNSWNAEETLYVGDSPLDAMAGREAGAKTAAALWDEFLSKGSTARVRYRERWISWDDVDVDLRLPTPSHLKTWVDRQKS